MTVEWLVTHLLFWRCPNVRAFFALLPLPYLMRLIVMINKEKKNDPMLVISLESCNGTPNMQLINHSSFSLQIERVNFQSEDSVVIKTQRTLSSRSSAQAERKEILVRCSLSSISSLFGVAITPNANGLWVKTT